MRMFENLSQGEQIKGFWGIGLSPMRPPDTIWPNSVPLAGILLRLFFIAPVVLALSPLKTLPIYLEIGRTPSPELPFFLLHPLVSTLWSFSGWSMEAMSASIKSWLEMADSWGSCRAKLLPAAETFAWRSLSLTPFCSCWRRGFTRVKFRPEGNLNIMPKIRSDMWPGIKKLAARKRRELIFLSWSDSEKLPLWFHLWKVRRVFSLVS